jgi:hypothetical protein
MGRQRRVGITRATATLLPVGLACVGLLLCVSIASGQGCPCAKRDLATAVKQADVIFAGRPLAATTDASRAGNQQLIPYQARFAFDVATVLKGSTTRATTVVTPVGPCGAGFVVGSEYLVIGKKDDGGGIVTDACQGNVTGDDAIRARAAAIRAVLAPAAAPPTATAAP